MSEREIKTIGFGRACRDRLGMYLSADPEEALSLGLREIYVNSLDALTETKWKNGKIEIMLSTKSGKRITVIDNGPGIPNKTRDDNVHSVVAAYTMPHTGSHFDGREVNSIGLNGIGASVVTHTAKWFQAISNDGKEECTVMFGGSDEGALIKGQTSKKAEAKSKSGVNVAYEPDSSIYGDAWFNKDTLISDLTEMMKFYPNVTLSLQWEDERPVVISFPNGLKEKDTKVYYESENLILSLSIGEGDIKPFGNRLYLPAGGAFNTHFKSQMTRIVNDLSGLKLTGGQIQSVFSGYVAIFVNNPLFSNQSKTAISNKEVNNEITSALKQELEKFSKTSEWAKVIKALEIELKAEEAAERAREKILKAKKDFGSKKINALSDKFIDTDWKKREECDLYLAEGDSAGGPIKRTKPNTAAVMMLRGKVLNTSRSDFEGVINNAELMMVAKAIGATMTETGFILPERSLRFGKIILAPDSDEDGAAIEALLLAYFYNYFPQLLKGGFIYGLAPKLFKIEYKGKTEFFANEAEMNSFIKDKKIRGYQVSRYKGLGSFTDDEFREQIKPETRQLRQFTIKSAERAAQAMKLMESKMDARRELIKGEFTWTD